MDVRRDMEKRNEDEWREREGIMIKRVKIERECLSGRGSAARV